MAGKTKTDATEALKQVTYLASALKAPRITEAAARLADHARDAGWTHEEYLAAILDRVRGLPCETLVSQRLLRTMEKARYSNSD